MISLDGMFHPSALEDFKKVVQAFEDGVVPMSDKEAGEIINWEIRFRGACSHSKEDDAKTGYVRLKEGRPSSAKVVMAVLVQAGIIKTAKGKLAPSDMPEIFRELRLSAVVKQALGIK